MASTASSTDAAARPVDTKGRNRVLSAAAIGQFVEWYDFVIYAYTASVIATLFFPSEDRVASILATFAIYAVGFVMRPVGGLVFGHLGDRLGRRGVLAAVILLMGGATAGIGMLPTYQQIGVAAPLLLVVCRLVQGMSAGAETTGSNALVAEHSPDHKRGFFVSLTYSFANLPAVFASLFVLFLTQTLTAESYESWGWRIPFLFGGLLSLVGLYIRRKVDESPTFEAAKKAQKVERSPIVVAIKDHPRELGFAFALAALSGLGFYTLTGYFTTYLREAVGLSADHALISNSIALTLAFVAMPIAGWFSDRVGRKPMLIGGAVASALAAVPAYQLASSGTLGNAIIGQGLLAITLSVFFGPFGVAFLEIFPTRTRFSGAALGYNAAYVLFGGTAPLFATWLVDVTGSLLAPAVYMVIVALAVALVAVKLPEGRTRSLHDEPVREAATTSA